MEPIETSCPDCGRVDLLPGGFLLTVFDAGDQHYYEFFCPKCFELVRRPADDQAQLLLMTAGVRHVFEHLPEELLEEHWGPPLTPEDAMDLLIALRTRPQTIVSCAAGSTGQDSNLRPAS